MSIISVQPKGGYKNQKNFPLKDWKAECPKCSNIELKEEDGFKCPNCNGDVQMTFAKLFNGREWESEEVRKSYRVISCVKGCGWQVDHLMCSKCNAVIQGDFFKGNEPKITTNCFVASSAFNNNSHQTVYELQQWRDNFLSKKKKGRQFIEFYYKYGPQWASFLNKSSILKPFVRTVLTVFTKILPRN